MTAEENDWRVAESFDKAPANEGVRTSEFSKLRPGN